MRNGKYILVIAPEEYPGMKYRGRYCYEHHLVWWKNTGEIITNNIIIHHKNDNKHDNSFNNLQKMTNEGHSQHHGEISSLKVRRYIICLNCKKEFIQKHRPVQIFCSRKCIGLYNHRKRKHSSVV